MSPSHRLSGHLWTIGPHVVDTLRRAPAPAPREVDIAVEDPRVGSVHLTGRFTEGGSSRVAVVAVHGLGGDADSPYMRRAARAASDRGLACLRLNLRGADRGGDDYYHAGLTRDLHAALESPPLRDYDTLVVVGYSLGGHVALCAAVEGFRTPVRAVAAICAPLDLDRTAMNVDRPGCWLYRHHVLRGLREAYAAVAARRPVPVPPAEASRIRRMREWDDRIVAPRWGFDGANDYYERASVGPRLSHVTVPTLLVASESDPLVPAASLRPFLDDLSDFVDVRWVDGGHVGFPRGADLGLPPPRGLDAQVAGWLARHA